jgi:hypothetical protein
MDAISELNGVLETMVEILTIFYDYNIILGEEDQTHTP